MTHSNLSRRVGPFFAALATAQDKPAYPAGCGTSPRPAPKAAEYKPAHGGYPGTPRPAA